LHAFKNFEAFQSRDVRAPKKYHSASSVKNPILVAVGGKVIAHEPIAVIDVNCSNAAKSSLQARLRFPKNDRDDFLKVILAKDYLVDELLPV
jgi:hypothetical protein